MPVFGSSRQQSRGGTKRKRVENGKAAAYKSSSGAQKRPARGRPFSILGTKVAQRSVRAELVVDASGDEIDILTDAALGHEQARSEDGAVADEVIGPVLHEQVIVFDAGRPVRGEAIFQAGADRGTPTGVIDGIGE